MSDHTEPDPIDWTAVRRVLAVRAAHPPATDAATAFAAVRPRLEQADPAVSGASRSLPRKESDRHATTPRRLRYFAAGLGLVAVVVGLTTLPSRWRQAEEQSTTTREYTTRTAQRATVDLPDGTRALLAPNTTLRYTASSDGTRRIDLQGAAYFTVTHDVHRPFTVHTGAVVTRVLGTAFQVRRAAGSPIAEVAVIEGKVAARGTHAETILSSGRVARLTDSTVIAQSDSAQTVTAWTRGRLLFDDAPLSDVLAALHGWYGYDFKLADTMLARETVTTKMSVDDARAALDVLKTVLDVSLTFDGNVITLHPRQKSRSAAPATRSKGTGRYSTPTEVGK